MFFAGRQAALAILLFVIPSITHATGGRVALVIGNSNYFGAAQLANPENDAEDVASQLRDAGFVVREHTNLDRDRFHEALENFRHQASSAEIAVLFYAGHGLQDRNENYLVPTDAIIGTEIHEDSLISLSTVLGATEHAASRIIILDACRNSPFTLRGVGDSPPVGSTINSSSRGLAPVNVSGSSNQSPTLLAFATAPGSVAEDGDSYNSPFTSALKKYIATPGIEVRELFARVRADVIAATNGRQIPWDNSSLPPGGVYLLDPTTGEMDLEIRRPSNASVYVAGKLHGQGSTILRGLPAGNIELRISAPGYVTHEAQIPVRAGIRENVRISLRKVNQGNQNVLQQLNANRSWCCDSQGRKICLMPSGGPQDVPCQCPGREMVGSVCTQ